MNGGWLTIAFILIGSFAYAQNFARIGADYVFVEKLVEAINDNYVSYGFAIEKIKDKKITWSLGLGYAAVTHHAPLWLYAPPPGFVKGKDMSYQISLFVEMRYYFNREKKNFFLQGGIPWTYAIGKSYYTQNGVEGSSSGYENWFSIYMGAGYRYRFNERIGVEAQVNYRPKWKIPPIEGLYEETETQALITSGIRFFWRLESKKEKMEKVRN